MIPPQRTTLSGTDDALYNPAWVNNHDSRFDRLAFALYAFGFDDAGLAGRLTFTWTTTPQRNKCWIGLPYYVEDRWQWQQLNSATIDIPDVAQYIGTTPEMTNMLPVVVLMTGTAAAVLDKITFDEYYPANFTVLDPAGEGSGTVDDPLQADNKLTLFLSVFDSESFTEVAADPLTTYSVDPPTAGEVQQLDRLAAFHNKAGYTGAFTITAHFMGYPTEPPTWYFTALDTGPATNQPPIPKLSAKPTYGAPPLSVAFDARGSYDLDGLVKLFRWDFDGDGTFDDTSNNRTVTHAYASEGIFDALLEIEDAAGATAQATVRITATNDPAQWHLTIVQQAIPDGISAVGEHCSLCEVDGKPAIAYSDRIELELASRACYIRASDSQGSTWGDPVELHRTTWPETSSGQFVQLRMIGGQPALAFCTNASGYAPFYLRATDPVGAAWPSPLPVDDASATSLGYDLQLIELGGVPALAYTDLTNGQLIFIKGTDADGTSFTGRLVLDTKQGHDDMSTVGEYCSLALISGQPAISYLARYIQYETGYQVRYIRATDAGGTAWAAPVVLDQAPSIGYGTALLELPGGVPGVFYQDYGLTQVLLSFVRGADAAGSSWSAKTSAIASAEGNWFEAPSPVMWNGAPFLGCILQEGVFDVQCTVQAVSALAADGSSWGSAQDIAATGESCYHMQTALIGGQPAMCFYNSDQQALYFGIYY